MCYSRFMAQNHTHRWAIATPAGPMSRGTCACGASRLFANADEYCRKDKKPGGLRINNSDLFRPRVSQRQRERSQSW